MVLCRLDTEATTVVQVHFITVYEETAQLFIKTVVNLVKMFFFNLTILKPMKVVWFLTRYFFDLAL